MTKKSTCETTKALRKILLGGRTESEGITEVCDHLFEILRLVQLLKEKIIYDADE
jgi:hypothetical protein